MWYRRHLPSSLRRRVNPPTTSITTWQDERKWHDQVLDSRALVGEKGIDHRKTMTIQVDKHETSRSHFSIEDSAGFIIAGIRQLYHCLKTIITQPCKAR